MFQFIPNAWKIAQRAVSDMLSSAAAFSANGTKVTVNGSAAPVEMHANYAIGIDAYVHADAGFRAPYFNFYKSRGTEASPTSVTLTGYEQDSIGGINFGGYDGSAYFVGCGIYTQVSHNWTTTRHGSFVSIYSTDITDNALPRQVIQFGGLDSVDLVAGTGTIDTHIIAYRPISFNGNKAANPCIVPHNSSGGGDPTRLDFKLADDSGFCDIQFAQLFFFPDASVTPSTNGQLTVQKTSNTQITFKLKGSDGVVRSGSITLS